MAVDPALHGDTDRMRVVLGVVANEDLVVSADGLRREHLFVDHAVIAAFVIVDRVTVIALLAFLEDAIAANRAGAFDLTASAATVIADRIAIVALLAFLKRAIATTWRRGRTDRTFHLAGGAATVAAGGVTVVAFLDAGFDHAVTAVILRAVVLTGIVVVDVSVVAFLGYIDNTVAANSTDTF